jgi:GT2 family glycosyltransferase
MTEAAVVILNWNKAEQTRHCVEIARQTTAEPVDWIVVDNGSVEPISGLDRDVTLLLNSENLGFAGGVNRGLRHAFALGAEYVWLLNNDAEPLPGALDALLAAARQDPSIGLASAIILNADGNDAVEFHGGLWDDYAYRKTADPMVYARWVADTPGKIWLVGTALLVNRRLIERIGFFDEAMFAYWEDNDISRRCSAGGFRNVVVPEARVRHESGHPADHPEERPPYFYYYMTRNELMLMRKMGELMRPRPLYWMLRRTVRLFRRLKALPAERRAVLRGVVDGVLLRGGVYRGG